MQNNSSVFGKNSVVSNSTINATCDTLYNYNPASTEIYVYTGVDGNLFGQDDLSSVVAGLVLTEWAEQYTVASPTSVQSLFFPVLIG